MNPVSIPLAILFAILYTTTVHLSKGIQKYGIAGLSLETIKQWKTKPEYKKNFSIWLIGSIGTIFGAVFQFFAQQYAPNSSFVPAFTGIGLLSLVIFCHFVLDERIKRIEYLGTIIIVFATFGFTFVALDVPSESIDYGMIVISLAIPLAILCALGYWSAKNDHKGHAVIWGSVSGLFSGFAIVMAHTAAIEGQRNFIDMLLTFNILFAIICSQGAFWFTQVGFKHGQASIVVTMFSSLSIGIPIIMDYVALDYTIPPLQLILLICIAVGVVLLTAFRKPPGAEISPAELPPKSTPDHQID